MHDKKQITQYSIENILSVKGSKSDFDLFSFKYFAKDIEHLKHTHRHNFYALIFTTKGNGRHTIDFAEYEIIPQRVFLITYGQLHHWDYLRSVSGFIILFTEAFYNLIYTGNDKIKSDKALVNNQAFVDLDDNEFKEWNNLIRLIEEEYLSNATNCKEVICLMLKALILKYNRKSNKVLINANLSSRKHTLIGEFKAYIEQYYKEWKLPKLYAQLMNITPNYLNSICKEVQNKSATELIKDRIILEAKRLLIHTDDTVTQIAYELGFEDNSHFGKYFKSALNITPDQYRTTFLKHKK